MKERKKEKRKREDGYGQCAEKMHSSGERERECVPRVSDGQSTYLAFFDRRLRYFFLNAELFILRFCLP